MTRQEIEFALQEIYIGLLGRAADPAGLDYWADEVEGGLITLEQVRTNIVSSQPEYEDVFGGLTRAQTVNQLYINLFGREAEPEGLTYWVSGGGATVPVDLLVFALSDGALGADRLVLDNKVTVAQYFTANTDLDINTDEAQFKAAAAAVLADVDSTTASVNAAKAMVDAGSYFVGETIILTAGQDVEAGTANNDTFLATNGTINSSDVLDGGAGDDTLEIRAEGSFNVAPSLTSIENIIIKGSSVAMGDLILDLSDSDGQNVLETEETTGASSVQFRDIQDVNGTNIRILDTVGVAHHYTYDTNAYLPGAGNDVVELYLEEVGDRNTDTGPIVSFGNTGAALYTGNSNVDEIRIVSEQRDQITDTTQNYLDDLRVGNNLQRVFISGTADFEVEDELDVNVRLVNASALDADLWLDLHAQGLSGGAPTLTVVGALGNDNIDIYGDGRNDVRLGSGEDNLNIYGDGLNYVDLGVEGDYLSIYGDVVGGASTVIAGEGNDYVSISGGEDNSGNYDIELNEGNDYLYMSIDGQQTIDAGDGEDYVEIYGNGYHDIDLGDDDDTLYIYGAGINSNSTRTSIDGGDGNDYVYISANHRLTVDLGEGDDELDIRADDLSSTDIITGNEGIDTLTLRNSGGDIPAGRVTASETDNTSSIEVFRLEDENILLELDDNLFETAQDNTITVNTASAYGTSTVDITRVNTNNYQFNLVGGSASKQDIVIANDETVDSFSNMDFGGGLNDILRVVDGATLTEEDLENVTGLEIIELVSDSNSPQEWRIDLNNAIINQTTGTPTPLVIRIDHRVPHGSTLYIDTSAVVGGNDGVLIERSANVTVIVDGVDVNAPGFVAPGWMTVNTRLIFTDGNDSLIGTGSADHFYAYDPSHVNGGADFIDGNGGYDTVHFDYSLENQNQTIGNQLNGLLWQEIEELSFNMAGDIKVNRVRAEGLGAELAQVSKITTGNGNDDLRNMAHGKVWDLMSGNDSLDFDNVAGTSSIEGGAGIDSVTGGDYGDTVWLSNVEWVSTGAGNDVINYNYGNGNSSNITVNGGAGEDLLVLDQNGTNGIALVSFVETITGGNGADTISASNTQDMTITGGSGNDTITVTSGIDVSVNGGNNDDTITVTVSSDASIDGGSGNDVIVSTTGDDVTVNGGLGDDTITVTYGTDLGGTDDAIINGNEGNDTITIIEGAGADGATVNGGLGQDTINLFLSATGADDMVMFGNIVYTGLQQVNTGSTTQNYAPQAIPGQVVVTGYNNGKDVINNFNFEDAGGAGQDDVLNFDAFLTGQTLGVNDYNDIPGNPGGISSGAIEYGNWTGGVNAVDMDRGIFADTDAAVAVIAANNGFVLNASHINTAGGPGIELDNGQRAVVMIAKDTNGDFNYDQVDIYFVQDVDGGPGAAWAVDLVATVNSATEIGAITSINLSNMTW